MNEEFFKSLQNFANNFGLEVHNHYYQDRRKKQKYFLTKDKTSV